QVVVRPDLEGAIAVVGVGVNPDFIVEQFDREGLGLGCPRQVDARGLEQDLKAGYEPGLAQANLGPGCLDAAVSMVEVDSGHAPAMALPAEDIDHRLSDSGGIDIDHRSSSRPFASSRGDPGEAVGHVRVGSAERQSFEVADEKMFFGTLPERPAFRLHHTDRSGVPALADVNANHSAHSSTVSLKARSTSSRLKAWVWASTNSQPYSWANHHWPIVRCSSSRNA